MPKFHENAETMSDFRGTAADTPGFGGTLAKKKWLRALLILVDIREKHCQYNALGNIVSASALWTWGFGSAEVTAWVLVR